MAPIVVMPGRACSAFAPCGPGQIRGASGPCSRSIASLASCCPGRSGPGFGGGKGWGVAGVRKDAWLRVQSARGAAGLEGESDGADGPKATGAAGVRKRQYSLPGSKEESVEQARMACRQAIRNGETRLQLELLLPLIGATDLDDWPGGIQQQFKAAAPMVSSLLSGLLDDGRSAGPGEDGGFRKYIIADEDAVAAWESDSIALVLFPTAESLSKVEDLANVQKRPLLLMNAQWQSGQVISDFGIGARRKERERFVASFVPVYFLKQLRILGEDVRLLRQYPGDWQVFVVDAAGGNECVATEPEKPSYTRLQEILKGRKGSNAQKGWLDRLLGELKFNQDSLKRD